MRSFFRAFQNAIVMSLSNRKSLKRQRKANAESMIRRGGAGNVDPSIGSIGVEQSEEIRQNPASVIENIEFSDDHAASSVAMRSEFEEACSSEEDHRLDKKRRKKTIASAQRLKTARHAMNFPFFDVKMRSMLVICVQSTQF